MRSKSSCKRLQKRSFCKRLIITLRVTMVSQRETILCKEGIPSMVLFESARIWYFFFTGFCIYIQFAFFYFFNYMRFLPMLLPSRVFLRLPSRVKSSCFFLVAFFLRDTKRREKSCYLFFCMLPFFFQGFFSRDTGEGKRHRSNLLLLFCFFLYLFYKYLSIRIKYKFYFFYYKKNKMSWFFY